VLFGEAASEEVKVFDDRERKFAASLWRERRGDRVQSSGVCAFAFSPDGRLLATGYRGEDSFHEGPQPIALWDARTWAALRTLEGHERSAYSLAFTADGK